MRSGIIFLLVIVSLSNLNGLAYGQDVEYRDSLFNELEKGSIDTMVFFELCQCININLYNDPDQSMMEARRVLNFAFAASYYRVIPKILMYQGISYDLNGKYDSAIIMYDSALIMAEKYGLKADQGSIYNNYSIVYSITGQLEQSLD